MRAPPRGMTLRPLTIAILMGVLSLSPVDQVLAADQKQVLVVYSTRRDAQVAVLGDRDLPRMLEAGLGGDLDFYSEYVDLARASDPAYQSAFGEFLRSKYRAQRFDVVVAIQDVAVNFVSERRDDLFPGTPLVFVATPGPSTRIANSTGVTVPLRLDDTLALAVQLQPDLRNVFVVSGADPRDQVYEQLARAQTQSNGSGLAFTYLSGLPTRALEVRLSALPEHSAIYYLLVNRDGAGARFHPLDYLDRLAAVANAPIYSWVDSALDHGILGGSLKSLDAQTQAVGNLALRVLRGERADDIPVTEVNLNVNQVDWRQMRRWGIDEARLPQGTLIRFRAPSIWDRYRIYILGAGAILLAQTALIAALLVQGRWRRQAEREVRRSHGELRTSYERIRDLVSRLLTAQDTERSRIARELHDDISQQLALLSIDLELLSGAAPTDHDRLSVEALNRAQDIAKSIHDLSHRLHPAKLRLIGLVPALEGLRHELSRSEIAITFTHDAVPATLPQELTLSLFRVAQEALQNAVKYSKAREIRLHLGSTHEGLVLVVADDGVGFDVEAAWGRGLGLVSISERLEAIGGTLAIQSTPGNGTHLSVKVPLDIIATDEAVVP